MGFVYSLCSQYILAAFFIRTPMEQGTIPVIAAFRKKKALKRTMHHKTHA